MTKRINRSALFFEIKKKPLPAVMPFSYIGPWEIPYMPMWRPKPDDKCWVLIAFDGYFKWYRARVISCNIVYVTVKYKFGLLKLDRREGKLKQGFSSGEIVFRSLSSVLDFIMWNELRSYIAMCLLDEPYTPTETSRYLNIAAELEKTYEPITHTGRIVPHEFRYKSSRNNVGLNLGIYTDWSVERKDTGHTGNKKQGRKRKS